MSPRDRLLAALVAIAWGLNFPATALALEHYPPFFMVALRFALLAVPTIFLIPRPAIPVRWLLAVGGCLGILQFAFLYLAMNAGLASGLASIVLQASAPFTVVLAGFLLGERITKRQAIGIGIAVLGLLAIALHRAQVAAILPVLLALCAALGWALGNVASRRAAAPNPLHLTLWMSVVPPLPMLALSLLFEGPRRIAESLATAFTADALPALGGLLYVVIIATIVGYGIWNTLLSKYPSSTVAPFSMLVPVIGVLASWLVFGEIPDGIELFAGAFVVGGVLFASYRRRAKPALPGVTSPDGNGTGPVTVSSEASGTV
ncbi:EamA family transporter [Frondihabitans sp. Leaf304]|uniref:EamA family transporter n=1 Tax=Frondihabitans sp. Leaf304 TaxID=1736329 RepID=UPI0009FF61A6|nr:EamA family transporter [Frondihabitans sp. Leaf304]